MIAEVLFIDGCPHRAVAVALLVEAEGITGLDLVVEKAWLQRRRSPQRIGFGGSPSIHLTARIWVSRCAVGAGAGLPSNVTEDGST